MTPLERAIRAVRLLECGVMTKADLAEALGVGERAVKRYLRAIRDAGVDLCWSDDSIRTAKQGTLVLPRLYWVRSHASMDSAP